MSSFEVLGRPDVGLPEAYRGTARDIPTVIDELGVDHPANAGLLALLYEHGLDGRIEDLSVARRLYAVFREAPARGPFEIVELVKAGGLPSAGTSLLGYDVAMDDGLDSLIATVLLYEPTSDPAYGPIVARLRHEYAQRLSSNLLFDEYSDAEEFREAATQAASWEGPEISWEVVGVWSVPYH